MPPPEPLDRTLTGEEGAAVAGGSTTKTTHTVHEPNTDAHQETPRSPTRSTLRRRSRSARLPRAPVAPPSPAAASCRARSAPPSARELVAGPPTDRALHRQGRHGRGIRRLRHRPRRSRGVEDHRPTSPRRAGAGNGSARRSTSTGRVTHRNVCRIHDHRLALLGIAGGGPLYPAARSLRHPWKLLRGETLSERLARRGTCEAEACAVRQMAARARLRHRAGIVHREFKSANVVPRKSRRDPRVVTDLGWRGLPRRSRAHAHVVGAVMGSPAYMAHRAGRRQPAPRRRWTSTRAAW